MVHAKRTFKRYKRWFLKYWRLVQKQIHLIVSLDFLEKHADIFGKKWSRKQQVVMTALISGFILFAALLIGGSVYAVGRWVGVFGSQSLHTLIYESIKNDPAFWAAAKEAMNKDSCNNTFLRFHYTFTPPLKPIKLNQKDICTQVAVPALAGEQSGVSIKILNMPKADALALLIADLMEIETDSFNHTYDATIVRAYKNGNRFVAVTLNPTPEKTYLIEYYPAYEPHQALVHDLVTSFRID